MLSLEEESKKEGSLKFAFFKDGRGMFRIQALPGKAEFSNRVSLHKDWRGLRGEEL